MRVLPIRMAMMAGICLMSLILAVSGCGGGGGGTSPANVAPEAQFTVSVGSGSVPLTVLFNASGSTDGDGSVSTYAWDFGDGWTGTGVSVTHAYETVGSYTAVLTVTDNDGSTDTASQVIVVQALPNVAPEAQFVVSVPGGPAPLAIEFNASGSADSDGSVAGYAWSFGDGETGIGAIVTHTYTAAGTYAAVLTVTDDDGQTDTASRVITVLPTNPDGTYTISGTVTSAAHMVTDSDVNDPYATSVSNSTFSKAQKITSPITVSGYVNIAHAGEEGTSIEEGDADDYFEVALTGGMNINLYMVEDPDASELNLYLYDSGHTLKHFTGTETSGIASLTAPADGTYYVRVEAVSDASRQTATVYALTVGLDSSAAAEHPLLLSQDFVPGEVLVRFEDGSGGGVSTLAKHTADVSALGLSAKAGRTGKVQLLRRSESTDRSALFKNLGIQTAVEKSLSPGNMDSKTRAKMETLWMVRALRKQTGVRYADPNYIRKPLKTPDDTYYSSQWHYPLINLPNAWDITTGSSNVVVAVVDTGVLLNHPDLQGQLVAGYDFISDTDISQDGDGVDSNPDDSGDEDLGGSSFHGTHVAGTIAAATDNATGVAGIAWKSRIMPLRALGKGGGTIDDILQAVKYAAGLRTDADYDAVRLAEPVDIINLSLGSEGYSQIEEEGYQEARDQGVIIIAAAGNSGNDSEMYPAAYDGVVSVSAVGIDESLASYSNYGATVDVAAPGGDSSDLNGDGYMDGVLSTIGDDTGGTTEMGYAFNMGTSMATPHVSGVAALMKALYPAMTPDEFDALLAGGYLTRDIGASGKDNQFGYGLIDAYKAVLSARNIAESGGIPAILTASPGNISFGTTLSTAVVTVKNSGNTGEALSVTGISKNVSWLSVQAAVVDANGLGTYTFTVTRPEALSSGTYSGAVTFQSNENQAKVSVIMQVGAAAGGSDGGYHYILLMDSDFNTVDQASGAGENGVYEYSFPTRSSVKLAYGEKYLIYAGTDPNNDYYICDDGEACGAYLSMDQPVLLTVTGDMENIDFTTDINLSLQAAASSRFAEMEMPLQRRQVLKAVAP